MASGKSTKGVSLSILSGMADVAVRGARYLEESGLASRQTRKRSTIDACAGRAEPFTASPSNQRCLEVRPRTPPPFRSHSEATGCVAPSPGGRGFQPCSSCSSNYHLEVHLRESSWRGERRWNLTPWIWPLALLYLPGQTGNGPRAHD